ncbi:TadE/TadG family type IV pilus assembly protein [Paracraurococcus lichenis]|uniref:TadE/TadG family type IV pilus assembly protein n=1 Tax=Paracraurococcus lichenis TaxID=3064888 RepID=A0ABT9DZ07_9PROT|nr:TadE/TadG family type IV pilus assembly protein [Paracraurococcus sp. LOR1-02]MDO9709141.1 TadE/TadG family type IV pilus assembly protein [Paracraurococcus sp. LOR1-02]
MSLIRTADPRRGTAAVEFAILVPLLILFFVATAELVIYARAAFRLERTAAEVANVGSQLESVATADVAGLFDAAKAIAAPVLAWSNGTAPGSARTVISVVANTGNGNRVSWTCARGDSGLTAQVAGLAALPNGFIVPSGQSVLVVEVINAVTPWHIMAQSGPWFFGTIGPWPLRSYAILRPRTASLTTLSGACP